MIAGFFTVIFVTFTKKTELLVDLCQHHRVLPATYNCPTCGKQCRVDVKEKGFWCDKS